MKKLTTLAAIAFAFSSTAMAAKSRPLPKDAPGTIVMRINLKTGEVANALVKERMKPGTALSALEFTKVAEKGEKTGLSYTANNELNASSSRSSNLYWGGGLGYRQAGFSRQIYGFGGGYYNGGAYNNPWTGGAFYPTWGGNYPYYPYAYYQGGGDYAYALCGYPGYGYGGGYGASYYRRSSTYYSRSVEVDVNGGYGDGYYGDGGVATPYNYDYGY